MADIYVFEGGITVDGYMTTKQAAEKWSISVRQVQNYCKKEIIPNVIRVGTNYLIPENAMRPKYGFYPAANASDSEDK